MDMKGIAVSSGSACKNTDKKMEADSVFEPSHVLVSAAVPDEYVKGSLRITLGKENTNQEIEYIVASVNDIVRKLNKNAIALKL